MKSLRRSDEERRIHSDSKYQNPTDYQCPPCKGEDGVFVNQPSQLTAYMLVNTAGDLKDVTKNTDGTYALGTKIT